MDDEIGRPPFASREVVGHVRRPFLSGVFDDALQEADMKPLRVFTMPTSLPTKRRASASLRGEPASYLLPLAAIVILIGLLVVVRTNHHASTSTVPAPRYGFDGHAALAAEDVAGAAGADARVGGLFGERGQ